MRRLQAVEAAEEPMGDPATTPDGLPRAGPAETAAPSSVFVAEDARFLRGPQARGAELRWVLKTCMEFLRGFRRLHFVGPCVTVFGSARIPEGHPTYELGRALGAALASAGFTVMTGGGPGVMEAANRGAREAGGRSIGCNIELSKEQQPNAYLDTFVTFKHFFVRKVLLAKYSYAFVALPGGFGTLDEVFETATLIQTGKMGPFPLVLMGTEYWRPLLDFLRQGMLAAGTIEARDIDRLIVTDDPEAAAAHVLKVATGEFGLRFDPPRRPHWWLFERLPPRWRG